MASENMSLVPAQRMENNLNSQLLFQSNNNNPLRFGRGSENPGSKSGYVDDKLFSMDHRERGYFSPELRRRDDGVGGVYEEGPTSERRDRSRNWSSGRPASTPSSGDDDEEDDDEDDDDEGDGDGEVLALVGISGKNSHNSGCGGSSSGVGDKIGGGNSKDHAPFGSSSRQIVLKDGGMLQPGVDANRVSTSENGHQGRIGHFQKMATVAEHDGGMYYVHLLHGTEGSGQGQKDVAGDNSCGFNGRKGSSVSSDPGESLRAIFSDPITGALMDDAMILPCGHSFGSGGVQQVIKMKACYTCSHPVAEDSMAPNLSLRIAVQAFRREEDFQMYKASKRRRERFEQEKGYGDSSFSDSPRGRGVQFPFQVTDRVIIKGNKRTPQRFVGREAIVTTQCLNGWYVVKTLDNAESVKLQYRSLEKVSENRSSKPMSNKVTPNWL